jgi:hypothetical protein
MFFDIFSKEVEVLILYKQYRVVVQEAVGNIDIRVSYKLVDTA